MAGAASAMLTASLLASASACSLSADAVPGATLRGHGAGAALATRRWYYEHGQHVPGSSKSLLIDLHGSGSCASAHAATSKFVGVAHDSIIVWPQSRSTNDAWRAVDLTADDEFIQQIVADIAARLDNGVDLTRIYVTGHAEGCQFAQRLIAQGSVSGLVAAAACTSAALSAEPLPSTFLATPLMLVHGMLDTLEPYTGRSPPPPSSSTASATGSTFKPSAVESVASWAVFNGCPTAGFAAGPPLVDSACAPGSEGTVSVAYGGTAYTTSRYTGCHAGAEVTLVSLPNVGHLPYLGASPMEEEQGVEGLVPCAVDTTSMMWTFLQRFSRASSSSTSSALTDPLPEPTCETMPRLCTTCFPHSVCLLPGARCDSTPPPAFCGFCAPFVSCMPTHPAP